MQASGHFGKEFWFRISFLEKKKSRLEWNKIRFAAGYFGYKGLQNHASCISAECEIPYALNHEVALT
jgi:hypothetical protein